MKSISIFCSILLVLLAGCSRGSDQKKEAIILDDNDPIMSRVVSRTLNAQKRLNGSVFDYFPSIDIASGPAVLFVYNNNDCSTCIHSGIKMLAEISATASNVGSINVYNTSTDFSIDNFRPAFDTTYYDLLTERHPKPPIIASIPTPFIMILEKDFKVKATFFPISGIQQESEIESFYNSLNLNFQQ